MGYALLASPMRRRDRLHYIQHLDPIQDHIQICHLLAGYEFPWDMTRALELALFRTFCIPSISQLLDRTGEFQHRPQKRYDDTGLIVSSILKWGYDSDRGRAAIQRMNGIHSHFPIRNDDFIYVLSTFIYEPIRWIDRFGWRTLSDHEKQSLFYFWFQVGQQMHIRDIPSTYECLEAYNVEYEHNHFRYSEATHRIGQSTLELFLSWFPKGLHSPLKPLLYAMFDDPLITAFGFPAPAPHHRRFVAFLLRSRGHWLNYLPPRLRSQFYVDEPQRSYPHGFTLADVGPPPKPPFL